MAFFEYAVKVVAGRSDGSVVAPGEYWTAVNVHNPGLTVEFRAKVAVALPHMRPGPISAFVPLVLRPDQALEFDRDDILRIAKSKGFVKGFLVIQTNRELDVVAVYTASPKGTGVETIHTERVPARLLSTTRSASTSRSKKA